MQQRCQSYALDPSPGAENADRDANRRTDRDAHARTDVDGHSRTGHADPITDADGDRSRCDADTDPVADSNAEPICHVADRALADVDGDA